MVIWTVGTTPSRTGGGDCCKAEIVGVDKTLFGVELLKLCLLYKTDYTLLSFNIS